MVTLLHAKQRTVYDTKTTSDTGRGALLGRNRNSQTASFNSTRQPR